MPELLFRADHLGQIRSDGRDAILPVSAHDRVAVKSQIILVYPSRHRHDLIPVAQRPPVRSDRLMVIVAATGAGWKDPA